MHKYVLSLSVVWLVLAFVIGVVVVLKPATGVKKTATPPQVTYIYMDQDSKKPEPTTRFFHPKVRIKGTGQQIQTSVKVRS
ncbi:MAG: hypothetical protein ABH832_02805 [bacterium]